MSISVILEVILALFKFPDAMASFAKLISKTPDQRRQEIVADIRGELDSFESTGRPK